jgi:hypothetical protein
VGSVGQVGGVSSGKVCQVERRCQVGHVRGSYKSGVSNGSGGSGYSGASAGVGGSGISGGKSG